MSDRAKAYHRTLTRRAINETDVKWLRDLLVTVGSGFVLSTVRHGKMETPGVLDFVVPASLFAVWEGGKFLYQRFWVAPYTEFQDQSNQIVRLESSYAASFQKLRDDLEGRARRKAVKEDLGRILKTFSACEDLAWKGRSPEDYRIVRAHISELRTQFSMLAAEHLDGSYVARFNAASNIDAQVDKSLQMSFMIDSRMHFWRLYTVCHAKRRVIEQFLRELSD